MQPRNDPPVRPDGRCVCGCGRKLVTVPPKTMPKSLRPMFASELASEPFATSACCRAFHGCPLEEKPSTGGWDDPEKADRTRELQWSVRSTSYKQKARRLFA